MREPETVAIPEGGAAAEILAAAAGRLLASLPLAAPFLADWPALVAMREVPPRSLPVLEGLAGALAGATPATHALVAALVRSAGALAWGQSYTAEDFGPDFLSRYGWTELIGLRGPIPSTAIACGILMLGPGVDYPSHAHVAEELYLPLAGTALWTRGHDRPVRRPPGLPIHHSSGMPHAMRTEAEPLLALYVWRGGQLAAKSRIVGRRPTPLAEGAAPR